MEMVVGLLAKDEDLEPLRMELAAAGFAGDQIKVSRRPGDVWRWLEGNQRARRLLKLAAYGALIGLFAGGLYGIPAGIINCAIGACTLETSLVLLALITFYWTAAGGALGVIIGLDKLERDLYSYVEGARRGEAVLLVQTTPERSRAAMEILRHNHGTVVQDLHGETQ